MFTLIIFAALLLCMCTVCLCLPRVIRRLAAPFAAASLTLLFAGCAQTSTITETAFAADGTTIASQKVTETKESVIVLFTKAALEGNNIAIKKGGWLANVGVNAESNSYGIQAGSVDSSIIVAKDTSNGVAFTGALPGAWNSQKYSVSVTKDGITAEGSSDSGSDSTSTEASTSTSTKAADGTDASATAAAATAAAKTESK